MGAWADEEWEGDSDVDEDTVAPLLPTMSRLRSAPTHLVLLMDVSQSMNSRDVEGAETRLSAAIECAGSFLRTCLRWDAFSVIAFSDAAQVVACRVDRVAASQSLEALCLRGSGGTSYVAALQAAADLDPREVVLLSDGRPCDAKRALAVFQERLATTKVHGIGFGQLAGDFLALQQLCALSGAAFALGGLSLQGLRDAFTSVSTSMSAELVRARGASESSAVLELGERPDFEQLGLPVGKKGSRHFKAARTEVAYDGADFVYHRQPERQVGRRMKPCLRGAMRLVYGFADSACKATLLAKTSRVGQDIALSTARSTAVARHFAELFVQQVGKPCLSVLPIGVYEGVEGAFTAEEQVDGCFLKYNSNNGYVDHSLPHHDVVNAFLHFTYASSGGKLLVADCQGVQHKKGVILTDPQVLSEAGGCTYGPGDLGPRGIRACMASHRCGKLCRQLGLQPKQKALASLRPRSGLLQDLGRVRSSPASTSSWVEV